MLDIHQHPLQYSEAWFEQYKLWHSVDSFKLTDPFAEAVMTTIYKATQGQCISFETQPWADLMEEANAL